VDKFAMLPFNPRLGMLFGHVDKYCPQHGFFSQANDHSSHPRIKMDTRKLSKPLNPPELIIQDELHLINGPLGSMVGMYETTVDLLCTRRDTEHMIRPKYIASTATIRRAGDQIWNLYKRCYRRFPAPAIDYSDSFFVKEDSDINKAKLFVGVFPSDIGQKTVMVRTLSKILVDLAKIKTDGKISPDEWDDYWTLVSYFNTIRELGSAKTTMEDDVQIRVEALSHDLAIPVRDLTIQELTSRIDSKDLPDTLTNLNVRGDLVNAIDILACSNMFSVGVDVQRLGLMIMNSQPKSTSEYIQSTGRVGRTGSGLVVVLFNQLRPRDRSHFERFFDYHNRIQSHVEAMTVTPFAKGVRDRALFAQYVSMVRIISNKGLAKNNEAGRFSPMLKSDSILQQYETVLRNRMQGIDSPVEDLVRELDHNIDIWLEGADGQSDGSDSGKLYYKHNYSEKKVLLTVAGDDNHMLNGPCIPTPTSMRNVENEVLLHYVKGLYTKRVGNDE
jgi:hypothetical protein